MSLCTACGSIAFTSASISFDWDVFPSMRKINPDFFGYVMESPEARTSTFLLLFLLALAHVASKLFAIALLTSIRGTWAIIYLTGDMVLYLGYKAVRRDLRYYLNLPPTLSVLASVVLRPIMKILVDFACVVHFRHPNELGGFYWSLNLLLTQTSCLAAAKFFQDNHAEVYEGGWTGSSIDRIWYVAGATFFIWVFSLVGLLNGIDRKYLYTFFDFTTAKEYAVKQFENTTRDDRKMQIFTNHESYYSSIRGEVKAWIGEHYVIFEREKPSWWTELCIATIPDEFIAETIMKQLDATGGGKRRRSVVGIGGRLQFVAQKPARSSIFRLSVNSFAQSFAAIVSAAATETKTDKSRSRVVPDL